MRRSIAALILVLTLGWTLPGANAQVFAGGSGQPCAELGGSGPVHCGQTRGGDGLTVRTARDAISAVSEGGVSAIGATALLPIRDVEVGDLVVIEADLEAQASGVSVPETRAVPEDEGASREPLYLIAFDLEGGEGRRHAQLLRSLAWIEREGIAVGRSAAFGVSHVGGGTWKVRSIVEVATETLATPYPGVARVTGRFIAEDVPIFVVRTEDGTTLETTAVHPFWSERAGGWVSAADLRPIAKLDSTPLRRATTGTTTKMGRRCSSSLKVFIGGRVTTADSEDVRCRWRKKAGRSCQRLSKSWRAVWPLGSQIVTHVF